MGVTSEVFGDTTTIKVSGRFDFAVQNEFRDCYRGTSADDGAKFIVDMSNANYMDSSGLGMLLMMREHLGGEKAQISITNCSPDIENILHVANFQSLFKMK